MILNTYTFVIGTINVMSILGLFSEGWDVMNEPAYGDANILSFIQHFTNLINALDKTHFTCSGGSH